MSGQDAIIPAKHQPKPRLSNSVYNSTAQAIIYKKNENWDALRLMLSNDSSLSAAPNTHPWAAKPTTAKALAMSFLAEGAQKTPSYLAVYVREISKELLEFLESRSPDLRDHSLLFLVYTVDCITSDVKQALIDSGLYGTLIPLLKLDNLEVNLSAAYLCSSLYLNSQSRQLTFMILQGHIALIDLLKRITLKDKTLNLELLMHLRDLMVVTNDAGTVYLPQNIAELKNTQIRAILSSNKKASTELESQELIEEMLAELS